MRRCKNCSAPISGVFCDYCGSRNDLDLGAFKTISVHPEKMRPCPVCHTAMRTIDIGEKVPFLIERCDSCYGLFFDKSELETLIDMWVKGTRNVDLDLLQELTENPRYVDVVVYRRCPVCRNHMNRRNFRRRSGVIMDECAKHGIWLDPGELRQIMEWVKAGGVTRIEEEERRQQARPQPRRKHRIEDFGEMSDAPDLFDTLSDFFGLIR